MKRTISKFMCLCLGMILTSTAAQADPLSTDSPDTSANPPGAINTPAATTPTNTSSPVTAKTAPAQKGTTTTPEATEPKEVGKREDTGFWTRDYLTGDWGGLRTKLSDDGLDIAPTWIGEVFGNPTGGAKQGIETNGLFNVALDFDLEKMSSGAVSDLQIHVNALYIYGPGLSPKFVGDFSNTSNIQGYNSVRLQELWVQKLFFDKKLSVKVGNIAIDTEFFQSSSSALFLNGTFGTPDMIADNIPNVPTYPVASPGVRVQYLPTDKFYVMAGVFGMDLNSSPATDNHYGTHFAMNGGSGMLVMSEAGFLLNQGEKDTGLQGTYRMGSFVETDNWLNWNSLQSEGANYGVYGVIDQQIFKKDDRAISLFVRGGGAPSNINFVDAYIDGGFNFTGFVPGRKDDVAGVALAHARVSGDFSNSSVAAGGPPSTEESVLETTYKFQMAPWWTIQPDFQYVMNPSGVTGSPNAVVFAVRTSVAF